MNIPCSVLVDHFNMFIPRFLASYTQRSDLHTLAMDNNLKSVPTSTYPLKNKPTLQKSVTEKENTTKGKISYFTLES